MRSGTRQLVTAVLAVFGVGVAAIAALFLYANTKYTVCYGLFESRRAAESAADAGRNAGFDVYVDHRQTESAVEFESGETGGDAREAREAFRAILTAEGGTSGHGDYGCLEREPFDH